MSKWIEKFEDPQGYSEAINQIKEWQHNENKTQRQTLIYKTQKTKDPAKQDTLKTGGALDPPEG